MSIRVLICDDHPLFRQGLRGLLETLPEFEVVGDVERGDELVAAVQSLRPGVVILDVELPGSSGIAAAEQLRERAPEAGVLMLSGFGDARRVKAALNGGARGYVLKNAPPTEIIAAVRSVAAGKSVLGAGIADEIATSLRTESEESRVRRLLGTLSERELEVLRLIAEGTSNSEIGKRLFISEGTVKNHITHILRKLRVEDRTQAAILAVRHGVVA